MPSRSAPSELTPLKRIVHPSQRSIFYLVWQDLVALSVGILLLLPTWILVLLLLPVTLFAGWCLDFFMTTFLRESYAGFERVKPWDAVWLGQNDPSNPPITMALLTLQRGLTFQEVRALVLDRIVLAKYENDNMMYPRFMQKVVQIAGVHAWVFDGEFDPNKHIVALPNEVSCVETLRGYMAEVVQTTIPTSHPLWTLHIRTDFGVDGNTILLFRYHQAMTDGISLVKILCRSMTDKTQGVYHIKSRFGGLNFTLNTFRSVVMASVFFLANILIHPKPDWKLPKNPFYDCRLPVGGTDKKTAKLAQSRLEVFWVESLPLTVMERISMVTRNSLHNILLTCLAGALRTCFAREGVRRMTAVNACIPVDLRQPLSSLNSAIEMGNQFVLLNFELPTDTIGSVPRLWKIRQEEDRLKNTSNSTSLYWIIQIIGHLMPAGLLRKLLARSIVSSCTISNVPGPDAQVYLDEKQLISLVFWPPSIVSQNVLSVSFFTYADTLQLGIMVDPDLCDAKALAAEFAHQVTELSDLLSNRRAPGEIKRRHSEAREPLEGLRSRILEVQRALVEAQIAIKTPPVQNDLNAWNDQATKIGMLKEELMEMLSAARRRKSVVEGVSMDFEEDEDMANEVRAGVTSPRRRTSSISSIENVSRFAVTPTRLSGSHSDAKDSFAIPVGRSRTHSNISETIPSDKNLRKISSHAHVIYITRDIESSESSQQV